MQNSKDIIILGGGPGGYVAAIRAAQLGFSCCVIEKDQLGGICLNWGCIPTKALLKSAEVFALIKESKKYGIDIKGGIELNFKQVIDRSRMVANKLSQGIYTLMQKNKIDVILGHGRLINSNQISVNDKILSAKNIIIATGARPKTLSNIPIDHKYVWDYKDAMVAKNIPKKLLIIGAGAIGVEYASFYNDIGSNVTLVEAYNRILPYEDEEISLFAQKEFEKNGINIITNVKLDNYSIKENKIYIAINQKLMEFDVIISAIGIVPNTNDIGITNTKVQLKESGHIITTNEYLQTNDSSIYAIGDVTAPPFLAHKASHEGIICVEKIADYSNHSLSQYNIPSCIYSRPQIASIGLSENQAKQENHTIRIGKFPFVANGKAVAIGESQGFIKTIFDSNTGEILGVHMIGCDVTELINAFSIAKSNELTDLSIINSVFPHPTLSEMLHESVLASINRALHI